MRGLVLSWSSVVVVGASIGVFIVNNYVAMEALDREKAKAIEALEKLKEQLPATKQMAMNRVTDRLERVPDEQLYRLSWSLEPCGIGMVDCGGLTDREIKPIVDGLVTRRKFEADNSASLRTFVTSVISLSISFCSLVVSVAAFLKKGNADGQESTSPSPSSKDKKVA